MIFQTPKAPLKTLHKVQYTGNSNALQGQGGPQMSEACLVQDNRE